MSLEKFIEYSNTHPFAFKKRVKSACHILSHIDGMFDVF